MNEKFSYEKSLKTNKGNDFLNLQKYLFVTSDLLTRFFYRTKVTPHLVILLSMISGLAASYLIVHPVKLYAVIGSVLLFYKNVLDKVDGSLARAKGLDSRRGRFYDSLSDFIVTFAVFTSISIALYDKWHSAAAYVPGYTAMIFSMMQCSYFIFYQVSFIKATGKNTVNRVLEYVTREDRLNQDRWTIFLQELFMIIYGWQDKFFYNIDKLLLNRILKQVFGSGEVKKENKAVILKLWYMNKPFLTLSSSLSIGTHIFLICISAIIGDFIYYLIVNLILMNLLLILSIIYHYSSTLNQLKKL